MKREPLRELQSALEPGLAEGPVRDAAGYWTVPIVFGREAEQEARAFRDALDAVQVADLAG